MPLSTDLLQEVGLNTATTLDAPGYTIGGTSINVASTANMPTATGITVAIDVVDSDGVQVPGSYNEYVGVVSSATQISSLSHANGTDRNYSAGVTTRVYLPVSAERENRIVEWGLEEHAQDGTHTDITADSIVVSGNVTADSFTVAGTGSNGGWEVGLPAPDTVTYNGNGSYDLVFNGNDLTDTVSEGMRLRTTRTVAAPTQCTDLEQSSSQYWSKTSPAGITFTDDFTCAAWVKLESYGSQGGIIARRNADTEGWSLGVHTDGRLKMLSLRIASNNREIATYQSLPLNKWVHVAATMDNSGNTHTMYINGVSVPFSTTTTGTITALVQGTTALVVGAEKSAGTNPFDGKIAQASVHSAVLSAAQIQAMYSQTISSSTPSIVSGFTFNGVATDVSANANDLSAQASATATTVDSPFGNYLGGTLDYGIITKTAFSTNTTLTVQTPEGCTIPTSGGVSAVSYSTQSVPFNFPRDSGRWEITHIIGLNISQTPTNNTITQPITKPELYVPVGSWILGYNVSLRVSGGASTFASVIGMLSTTTSTETLRQYSKFSGFDHGTSASVSFQTNQVAFEPMSVTSATTFYLLYRPYVSGTIGASCGVYGGAGGFSIIKATPAYL